MARDYGEELRKMRKAAEMTQQNVADALPHWPTYKLSLVENGHQEPHCSEYDELREFYKANGAQIRRIVTYFRRDGGKHATLIVR